MPKPKPVITLTILRGAHDADMAEKVLPYIAEGSILFIEQPGTLVEQGTFERWANSITLQRRPGEAAKYQDSDFTVDEKHSYIQLIRALKDSNVLVRTIDETYDQPKTAIEWVTPVTILDIPVTYLEKADLPAIYDSIEARATAFAEWVKRRDTVMAEQVVAALRKIHAEYPEMSLHAMLLQGAAHHSRPYIAKLMPEVHIEEHIYSPEAVALVEAEPLYQVGWAKLQHPDKPVSQALIDRALVVHLSDPSLLHDGVEALGYNPNTTKTADILTPLASAMATVAKLDDTAVHARLVELLESYRFKGIWKLVVPPLRFLRRLR